MIPTDPAERDALAGEYVLGTLDARAAAAVERAMATDPALRAAVAAWEARLAPLDRRWPRRKRRRPACGTGSRQRWPARPPAAAAAGRRACRAGGASWRVSATAVAAGLLALFLLLPPERPAGRG